MEMLNNKMGMLIALIANFNQVFAKLNNRLSEEQVCKILIDPTITEVWEFKYLPRELCEVGTYDSEPPIMVGHDTKVYPDRLLTCYHDRKMVIEIKGTEIPLDNFVGQLETSVIASGASVGILTNGTEWRIYLTNTDGKMECEPFRIIYLMGISEDDCKFIANFFDPKYTINDGQMKRERDLRLKQERAEALSSTLTNALIEKALQPSIDAIRDPYKQFMHQTQVQASTLQAIYEQIMPRYEAELKNRLLGNAIADFRKAEAMKNKTEPEEYAIANLVEFALGQNHGSSTWVDDAEASRSIIQRTDSKKTIMWIVGEVSEEGYAFKGVCFPNINKNKGKLIPISDPKDVVRGDMFKQLLDIYDHINDPMDAWKTFYTANYGE